jgi:hypothetical protein
LKYATAKISLFILIPVLLISCNAVKRVDEGKMLLTENRIFVDGEKSKDSRLYNQLYQKPNNRLLGIPLGLHFYNLARPNPDSIFQNWLHKKPKREERLVNFLSRKQVEQLEQSYVA